MAKETFYFKHDYNARSDRKLVNVIRKHGMTGIGVYWCLIEMLYEEGGYLPKEYECITFELRTEKNVIESLITEFDLFKNDENKFWSESVLERLKWRCEKSEKARESIKKRWVKYERNTNELPTKNDSNTRKEKKRKEEYKNMFIVFWDSYHSITGKKKTDKEPAEKYWNKLNNGEHERAIENIKPYFDSLNDKKYCKKARTYLADKNFDDEYINKGSAETRKQDGIATTFESNPDWTE